MERKNISERNLKRLPWYHRRAIQALSEGKETLASRELAEALHIDESLVRKDLAMAGITGKPRVGYYVPELCRRLAETLGYGRISGAVLVGVGHLGTAIANYPGFSRMGLNIIALFDNSTRRIGEKIGDRVILDMRKLPAFLAENKPEVGVITVPPAGAPKVARILTAGGVKGIWDFSGARLNVPEGVVVSHADLAVAWSAISHKLKAGKSSDRK